MTGYSEACCVDKEIVKYVQMVGGSFLICGVSVLIASILALLRAKALNYGDLIKKDF